MRQNQLFTVNCYIYTGMFRNCVTVNPTYNSRTYMIKGFLVKELLNDTKFHIYKLLLQQGSFDD